MTYSLALEELVEAPPVAHDHWSLQIDLGREKEARYEDLLGGLVERVRHRFHVGGTVHQPSAWRVLAWWRERAEPLRVEEPLAAREGHLQDCQAPLVRPLLVNALDEQAARAVLNQEAVAHPGALHAVQHTKALVDQEDALEAACLVVDARDAAVLHHKPPGVPEEVVREEVAKVQVKRGLLDHTLLVLVSELTDERQV